MSQKIISLKTTECYEFCPTLGIIDYGFLIFLVDADKTELNLDNIEEKFLCYTKDESFAVDLVEMISEYYL